MSNDNKLILYRIRRKADGLYLITAPCTSPGTDDRNFGPTGCFWKTPETVRKHLIGLCTFRMFCGDGFIHDASHKRHTKSINIHNPIFVIYPHDTIQHKVGVVDAWFSKYEVVATEVEVSRSCIMESSEFCDIFREREDDADEKHG